MPILEWLYYTVFNVIQKKSYQCCLEAALVYCFKLARNTRAIDVDKGDFATLFLEFATLWFSGILKKLTINKRIPGKTVE